MNKQEIWKDVVGSNGYYKISSLGNIRSMPRTIKKSNGYYNIKEKLLTPHLAGRGYLKVNLSFVYRSPSNVYIHNMVAKAFIPNPKNKPEINHKNGIKTDNRAINLEWCTRKENVSHAVVNGLVVNGSKCSNSLLNEDIVYFIKVLLNIGETHQSISDRFNVTRSAITQIAIGKNWRQIQLSPSVI